MENRFYSYILGGKPKGSIKTHLGCSYKTLPKDKEEIYINSELYFAEKSISWRHYGIGFIKTEFNDKIKTFGRMYLIAAK